MRHALDCPPLQFSHTVAVPLLVALLSLAPAARAVDYEWDGGAGDNVWDTVILNPGVTTNWSPENVPISADSIILTAASAAGPVTIDVDGDREVQRIEHDGAQGDYTFGETIGADTITIFVAASNALANLTQGSDLIFNSNILLNQGSSVLRFNSGNAGDNSGHIVVDGDVSPSAAAAGLIQLSLTSNNKSAGPWVTVNGVISDGDSATIGLIAGVETAQSVTVTADHAGEVSVTGANTFTGPVQVTGGTLIFNSIENFGSADPSALGMPSNGNETIVMGDLNISSGTLRYVGGSTSSNTSNRPIEIVDGNTAATIDASGTVPLVLSGGINPSTSSSTTRTLNLTGGNTGANTISGVIQPAAGPGELNVNKNGVGKWILSGNSTNLDGTITVNDGELVVTGAIGSASSTPRYATIASGGTLTLDGGQLALSDFDNPGGTFNFKSGTLRLAASNTLGGGAGSMTIGTDGPGTLQLEGGDQIFGSVTLHDNDDALIASAGGAYQFTNLNNSAGGTVSGSSNLNFNINGGTFTDRVDSGASNFLSRIQGTGGFTKQGAGTLVFSGALPHTYSGNTRIEGGTLRVTTSDLPTVPTFIEAGATLDLENANAGDEVGRLTGAGMVISPNGAMFTVNSAGPEADFSGSISGLGDFLKIGTGKQILSGPSDYTGATSVSSSGSLEIATGGSLTGTSEVHIFSSTLSITGGTIDTPGNIDGVAGGASTGLILSAGLVKANAIERSAYGGGFNWTGGTLQLLTATVINGSTTVAVNRPFASSLTLDSDMALIVDDTFSVINAGVLAINGGSVTADTIIAGPFTTGNVSFNSGTMRMRNDQTFDTARLNALGANSPLVADKSLIVDGEATIGAPLVLAGGSFSAGSIVNPENLILSSGMLEVTASDLDIGVGTSVDVTSGMTVNVTSGALNVADGGEFNAINATLDISVGINNSGDVNLINTTVNGDLVNGPTGSASLLGSNAFGDVLVLSGSSQLFIDLAGDQPGEFDAVTVGGEATLGGLLAVSLSAGFTPGAGDMFPILTAGVLSGEFDNENLPDGYAWNVDYGSIVANTVTLEVLAVVGDLNGDNLVTEADVNPFVEALTNRAAYDLHGYGVNADLAGDVNGDGFFNLGDVGAFKSLIMSSGAGSAQSVPEPSVLLITMSAIAPLLVRRRRSCELIETH